jgi:hypothetical protein
MSMLARYKKGTGIVELVKLIEDSAEPKRSQLLQMVRSEDPEFAAKVEARLFSFEKIKSLSESVLAEIVAATPPKFVALAIWGEPADFISLCEKCLGKNYNEYKQEKEALGANPPGVGQIEAARRKLIGEARKLEASGQIKLPFSEPDGGAKAPQAAAPDTNPAATSSPQTPTTTSYLQGGTGATAEAGCPPIASFGLEAPPPGLSGERLEQFFKNNLG